MTLAVLFEDLNRPEQGLPHQVLEMVWELRTLCDQCQKSPISVKIELQIDLRAQHELGLVRIAVSRVGHALDVGEKVEVASQVVVGEVGQAAILGLVAHA